MDELVVGEHQVDGTGHLIYIYIYLYVDVYTFFAILASQVRCYCNLYFLSFIVTVYRTKFLYELYSNSRVLIYYIVGAFLFYILCQ